MTVKANLVTPELTVDAGGEVVAELAVNNGGELVDQYAIDVVGAPAAWATVSPAVLNLMPGSDQVVTVTFTPPRSPEAPAGTATFGVRVRSREYPDSSVVVEGTLDVNGFTQLSAELVPPRRRGRHKARYRLAVENAGNRPEALRLAGFDTQGDELDLRVTPAELTARPGTVTVVRVAAVARRRFLRGNPKTHPFQVEISSVDEQVEPIVVPGTMVQERVLPKWLLPAMAALAAAGAALVALWFAVLEPTVRSVAQDQVAPQVSQVNAAVSQASKAAEQASSAAAANQPTTGGGSGGGENKAATGGDTAGHTSQSGQSSTPLNPTDFRIASTAAPVTDGSYQRTTYTAPDGKAMDLGDLVLQNPRGDNGFLRISIGDQVVLEAGLANFRDLDYHYVNPLHVPGGTPVVLDVNCTAAGAGANTCSPSVSFSGKLNG